MHTNINQIIIVLFFIILVLAIYKPAKSAFNLETFPALVISGCVSALCIIGMENIFGDSFKVILLPYMAMGISILLIMLLIPICKLFKKMRKPTILPEPHILMKQNPLGNPVVLTVTISQKSILLLLIRRDRDFCIHPHLNPSFPIRK
ncbi:MAG: hypothetical protein JXA96_02945 [Sedimentisphaerales bacterium]|nr:hypothetical protein [Sedimentisphaerales bacterium]